MLSAKLPAGETTCKKVSDEQQRLYAGRILRAAFNESGLTDQEVTFDLDYANQSMVTRLVTGEIVPPLLVRLLSVPALRLGLMLALARVAGEGVEVDEVIRVRRRA
jgi:hypothetical protein